MLPLFEPKPLFGNRFSGITINDPFAGRISTFNGSHIGQIDRFGRITDNMGCTMGHRNLGGLGRDSIFDNMGHRIGGIGEFGGNTILDNFGSPKFRIGGW